MITSFNIVVTGGGGFVIAFEDELMRLPHSTYLSEGWWVFDPL